MKITLQLSEAELLEAVYQYVYESSDVINNIEKAFVKIEIVRNGETGEFVANIYASEDLQ